MVRQQKQRDQMSCETMQLLCRTPGQHRERGRRRRTYQLLAKLNGGVLIALLLALAAPAEDAYPPEPRRHRLRRQIHHLHNSLFLLDLHVIFTIHLFPVRAS
jgi:hypothetical protein